jgi:sugar lactone lactonase YvrE
MEVAVITSKHDVLGEGPVWDPRRGLLWWVDIAAKRLRRYDRVIYAFDYDAETGVPTNRRVFTPVEPPGYPDGSTVDAAGCLWNAEFNGWRLVRYTPAGVIDRIVELPVQSPTSCAFGGSHLDTLYVTSASRDVPEDGFADQPNAGLLLALDVGVSGVPEEPFMGRF